MGSILKALTKTAFSFLTGGVYFIYLIIKKFFIH